MSTTSCILSSGVRYIINKNTHTAEALGPQAPGACREHTRATTSITPVTPRAT